MADRDTALHPQAAAFLKELNASGAPQPSEVTLEEARAGFLAGCRAVTGLPISVFAVKDVALDLSGRSLGARLYRPSAETDLPIVVHFHGGGFVFGDIESHDNLCRKLCHDTGCAVLSVDYRLAPEYPFPAAVEDAFDSVQWVRAHGHEIGVDPQQIVLSGDSAGANLATVTAILMRDASLDPVRGQVLMYPVTDTAMDTVSYEALSEGYRLTRRLMRWYFDLYVPDKIDREDFRAAPLRTNDLSNLPPAMVISAGFDPLCDEGIAYVKRLDEDGTAVTHRHYAGAIHAFCNMFAAMDDGRDALEAAADWIRTLIDDR